MGGGIGGGLCKHTFVEENLYLLEEKAYLLWLKWMNSIVFISFTQVGWNIFGSPAGLWHDCRLDRQLDFIQAAEKSLKQQDITFIRDDRLNEKLVDLLNEMVTNFAASRAVIQHRKHTTFGNHDVRWFKLYHAQLLWSKKNTLHIERSSKPIWLNVRINEGLENGLSHLQLC